MQNLILPFNLWQNLRICLLASFHTLTTNSSNFLPELRCVSARSNVDQEVAEDRDLDVDVDNDLKVGEILHQFTSGHWKIIT